MTQKQRKFQIDLIQPHEILQYIESPSTTVVELYQRWAGPTPVVEQIFRQYYLDLSQFGVKFVRASSDIIPFARRFHGRCRPAFLVISAGIIQKVFYGINLPAIDEYFSNLKTELEKSQPENAKAFLPEVQLPELINDEVFQGCWQVALQQRKEAQEKVDLSKQNNVDTDIDPNAVFDNLLKLEYPKLEGYDEIQAMESIILPQEGNYQKEEQQQPTEEQIIAGMIESKSKEMEAGQEQRPAILSVLPEDYQALYNGDAESMEVAQILEQQKFKEENMALADTVAHLASQEGKLSPLQTVLLQAVVELRPSLKQAKELKKEGSLSNVIKKSLSISGQQILADGQQEQQEQQEQQPGDDTQQADQPTDQAADQQVEQQPEQQASEHEQLQSTEQNADDTANQEQQIDQQQPVEPQEQPAVGEMAEEEVAATKEAANASDEADIAAPAENNSQAEKEPSKQASNKSSISQKQNSASRLSNHSQANNSGAAPASGRASKQSTGSRRNSTHSKQGSVKDELSRRNSQASQEAHASNPSSGKASVAAEAAPQTAEEAISKENIDSLLKDKLEKGQENQPENDAENATETLADAEQPVEPAAGDLKGNLAQQIKMNL